eukprot:COSAG02_NODE_2791_length_8022_cov_5.437208_9_plen_51_part_00
MRTTVIHATTAFQSKRARAGARASLGGVVSNHDSALLWPELNWTLEPRFV